MISLRDVVMGFGARDPLAEVWRRSLRGGGGGAAEITGVPPLNYIGNGRPLTDYRIAGNTVQDGTPTPESPVPVVGCGTDTADGYKIPMTVNGTEYPIYLGTVPTTRRVKKLVLTGEEDWDGYADGRVGFKIVVLDASSVSQTAVTEAICSHFTADTYLNVYFDISVTAFAQRAGSTPTTAGFIFRSQTNYTKVDFIQFLKDQYTNGTPVTIWYVLAEPETAIVNEPLMKIGDYADTVSFAQAGVTIPTVNGANVLDVPAEVKPSQITIKGGISSV